MMTPFNPSLPPAPAGLPRTPNAEASCGVSPVFRAGPGTVKHNAVELSQEFGGPPRAASGTRYVVVVPTLWQGRHAGPVEIAKRLVHAMGGDAQQAADRIRLVVGVNRRTSPMAPCPRAELAALAGSIRNVEMPMRTSVTYYMWRPKWTIEGQPSDEAGVRDSVLRAALAQNPELAVHLQREDELVPARDGIAFMRSTLAKVALQWQQTSDSERVLTLVTDSDTEFPPDFFATLDALPHDVALASGGFRYNRDVDAFSSLQNRLDMHIRAHASIDKRFVYLPEPSLVVDSSRLGTPVDFGVSGLESRALFNFLHNQVAPLAAAHICFDRRLEVITDGTRFMHAKHSEPETFAALVKALCMHPQSHARLFTWSKQVASIANVRSEVTATLAALFSVPHVLDEGELALEQVPAYLDMVQAYFLGGHWTNTEHPVSKVFHRSLFPRSDATLGLVVDQMHAWAMATWSFVNDHLAGNAPLTAEVSEDALCERARALYSQERATPSVETATRSLAASLAAALDARLDTMDRIVVQGDDMPAGFAPLMRKRSHGGAPASRSRSRKAAHPVRAIAHFGRYLNSPERSLRPPTMSENDAEQARALGLHTFGVVRTGRISKKKGKDLDHGRSRSNVDGKSLEERAESAGLQFVGGAVAEWDKGPMLGSDSAHLGAWVGADLPALVISEPDAAVDAQLANDLSGIGVHSPLETPNGHDEDLELDILSDMHMSERGRESIQRVIDGARSGLNLDSFLVSGVARNDVAVDDSALSESPPEAGKRRRLRRGSRRPVDEAYPHPELLNELTDLIDTGGGILRKTGSRSEEARSHHSQEKDRAREALEQLRRARAKRTMSN